MAASAGRKWPGGIVPYVVGSQFSDVPDLNDAFAGWEAISNLRFVERTPMQSSYVEVVNTAEPCQSKIGVQGGKQEIGCLPSGGVGLLMHEIGHAVGLIHEQCRSDRDSYVRILWNNIIEGKEHNFELDSGSRNSPDYDFTSLMHYGQGFFSNGNGLTIMPRDARNVIAPSAEPTGQDWLWINAMYPDLGVVRRSDSAQGAGAASEISAVNMLPFRDSNIGSDLITAVQTRAGTLLLIRWRVTSRGGIRRIGDSGSSAGAASNIDIARAPDRDIFVTAVRGGSGLMLISWSPSGSDLARTGDSGNAAGGATNIKIIGLTGGLFVTACRSVPGRLLLISWRLNGDGSLSRLADSANAAGSVQSISLAHLSSSAGEHLLATTVETETGSVLIIVWRVTSDGMIIRRGDSGSATGDGSDVSSTLVRPRQLLISCKSGSSGKLLLISFSVSRDGMHLTRLFDSNSLAGEIACNSLVSRPYGALSAVADGRGQLLLIKWQVDGNGRIQRAGDSGDQAGPARLIGITPAAVDSAPLVATYQTASGTLGLSSWDDMSVIGELHRPPLRT